MSRRYRGIGLAMLAGLFAFLIYVGGHPQAAFPWGNGVTFVLYLIYLAAMVVMFAKARRG